MRLIALALVLVMFSPAFAADPPQKGTVRYLRGASDDFRKGLIVGIVEGYVGIGVMSCPQPVSGQMVLAVLDTGRPYEDEDWRMAVGMAMIRLGCSLNPALVPKGAQR